MRKMEGKGTRDERDGETQSTRKRKMEEQRIWDERDK
jgi:hypothetical protein